MLTSDIRFIAGQLHVLRPRRTDLARFLLAMMPLLVALLIAISRCEDYRHDVYDVTIGSFLGFTVAHHTYRRYYPTLRSSRCDMPYPVKQDTERKHGFGRVRDEEDVSLEGSVEGIPLQERKGKNRA